jgi:NADP-dependent 3-hydroxy acid dehydrogenase YdfG
MKNKTILITGGTQGLGKELAIKLDKLGANLIIVARRESFYNEFASDLKGDHKFYSVDVGDVAQVKSLAEKLADRQIDVLVNNAGIWTADDLEVRDLTRREDALKTNLLGAINITNAFLPNILKSEKPQLIFTNSIAGTQGFGGEGVEWATYNASKWGLKGYVIALKDRFRGQKIKISSIYPGGFDSNIYENAKDGDPNSWHNQSWQMRTETVANAVLFILEQPDDANVDEIVITNMSPNV